MKKQRLSKKTAVKHKFLSCVGWSVSPSVSLPFFLTGPCVCFPISICQAVHLSVRSIIPFFSIIFISFSHLTFKLCNVFFIYYFGFLFHLSPPFCFQCLAIIDISHDKNPPILGTCRCTLV